MRIFLDANILVSVLNKEYPVFPYSSRVLSLADSKKFMVWTSPICLAIAFYFAEKKSGTVLAKQKIEILVNKINIAVSIPYSDIPDFPEATVEFHKGQLIIGTVGNTGNAMDRPPHLHYSIETIFPYFWRVDEDISGWKKMFYLDPTDYMDETL